MPADHPTVALNRQADCLRKAAATYRGCNERLNKIPLDSLDMKTLFDLRKQYLDFFLQVADNYEDVAGVFEEAAKTWPT